MAFNSRFEPLVAQCEQKIGHTFTDKLLSAQSVNNAAGANAFDVFNGKFELIPKNDRLAIYGDSVMASILSKDWYHGGSDKAAWTSIRNNVLSNDSLAKTGFDFGLDTCINTHAGTTAVSKKMMATAVEAILGAVHLDGGDNALRRVMGHLGLISQDDLSVMFKPPFSPLAYRSDAIYSR
ncbi:hypothetical protein LLEC1_08056 [Akanthomyces lecanii]|uniref:RNase III domain-containing protein n=1 Tax=Cordyceps confragosa TaxID=2714763 RepID=A0A179I9N0_CORDF|nr:hypothetical protein LLEC1_08056 [Akanthomyces lecanii]